MGLEAAQLCASLEPPACFTFNCDRQLQAYAVYSHWLVVITGGLFDFLCQLVGRVVANGLFSTVGQPNMQTWNPDLERSKQIPRKLVLDEPFDVKSPPWTGDLERSGLFFYLLLTLFRFVVLHELGHFYHQHGNRAGDVKIAMDIDSIGPRILPDEEALNSQARELVADKFAMDKLLQLQENELERIARTKLVAPLGKKLLNTPQDRLAFLLNVAYLYFASTDRLTNASPKDAIKMSHPPAAFRLVTIAATAMENIEGGADDAEAMRSTVSSIGIIGDALLAVALDRTPDPAWLGRMQDCSFSKHYEKLYERMDAWTRKTIP